MSILESSNNIVQHDFINWDNDWENNQWASYQYKESHYKDETVVGPSYPYDGNCFTGKATFLYWVSSQVLKWETDSAIF